MGRKRVSGGARSDQDAGHRLKVKPRGNKLYIVGTLSVRGQRIRVRRSTGIDRGSLRAEEWADAIRIKTENEILDQIVYGKKPPVSLARVAADYIVGTDPGPTDLRNLDELLAKLGHRPIGDITAEEINEFYKKRFPPGRTVASRRRHQASLRAVYGFADDNQIIDAIPKWDRPKDRRNKRRAKGRAITKMFFPGEAELLIRCAAWHARPIMATEYGTGARTSSVIYLPKEMFVLIPGRGRVHFPETKNGNAYSRPLPDYAVEILLAWLGTRSDRHPAMFLTDKGLPYAKRHGRGGQIDWSFKTARQRCVTEMIRLGHVDRARVMARATPHWFRHNLANRLRRELRWDAKLIGEAGMWEDEQVPAEFYIGDESEYIEQGLRSLEFGTKLTQSQQLRKMVK